MSSRATLEQFRRFCRGHFCDSHLQIVNSASCSVSLLDKIWQFLEPTTKEEIFERFDTLYQLRSRFYLHLTPEERKGCNEKLNRLFALSERAQTENPLKKEAEEDEHVSNILPLHHFLGTYITYHEVTPERLPDFLHTEKAFAIPILKEIHATIARIPQKDMERLEQAGYSSFDVMKYLLVNRYADHEKDHPYYVPGLDVAREVSNIITSTIRWKQTGKPA